MTSPSTLPPHVGHFFRPLVDQQHDQLHFRIVGGNGLANVLEQHGFAGARRCHDQGPLAFADGGEQVDEPCAQRLRTGFQPQKLRRMNGRQQLELWGEAILARGQPLDLEQLVNEWTFSAAKIPC